MSTATTNTITVRTTVKAPASKAWTYWTAPEHATQWSFADDSWHAPYAENDLRVGGNFKTTLAAKDGSFSFDFAGTYTAVKENELLEFVLGDGRKVQVIFTANGDETTIVETFDPESENPLEMQRAGWQAFLDNYKKYVEAN